MLHPDPRAYRVALLADAVANEVVAGFDVLAMLDEAQFGVVILPPADFTVRTIEGIVEYTIDDLVDYRNSGYRVVIVGSSDITQFGVWSVLVDAEVTRRRVDPFERFDVAGANSHEFSAFLAASVPLALAAEGASFDEGGA